MRAWVISDVDGCVLPNPPAAPPPMALADLCRLVGATDRFTLCSGRSAPYVLAVRDILGGRAPVLAEYGAVLARSVNAAETLPTLRGVADWRAAVRRRLQEAGLLEEAGEGRPDGALEEIGKSVVVTLVPRRGGALDGLRARVAAALTDLPHRLADSQSAVDLLPPGLDKGVGLRWWAAVTGADLAGACAIGDSVADLDMLRVVGRPACPGNAAPEAAAFVVASAAGIAVREAATAGVVEVLRRVWVATDA